MFNIRQVGKTLATKTQGLKNSRDSLLGRVFEVSLGDLKTKVPPPPPLFHMPCLYELLPKLTASGFELV